MESSGRTGSIAANSGFAWLTILLAAWIIAGLYLLAYVTTHGISSDVLVSPYHAVYYSGLAVLAGVCLARAVRSARSGAGLRSTLPAGYGGVGVGVLMLLAWPVAELGWRDGIGIGSSTIEQFLAPTRLLAVGGAALVAVAPLWAAYSAVSQAEGRWPPAISAALTFILLSAIGFQPAANLWLEAPLNGPEDDSAIWVMNADGSHQTELIAAGGGYEVGQPAWSPDGSQIAYTRSRSTERIGSYVRDQEIWVAASDGSQQRLLIAGQGWYWLPHWSPDGAWITFTIDGPGGPSGAAAVVAPDVGFGQSVGASQSGPVAPNVDVWRTRSDGTGGLEQVTNDPAQDRAGVYSPDGQHMLFDSTRADGRPAIYVANADGSNPTRLTHMGDDWGAAWAPDGSRFAFHANPSGGPYGPYDIYVQTYPGGHVQQLTDDPATEQSPAWSPDGSSVAFALSDGTQTDIWVVSADGSQRRNLTHSTNVSEWMTSGGEAWSADGRIVYQRAPESRAAAQPIAFENLGLALTLFGALVLAALSVALVGIDARFGAITLVIGAGTAAAIIDSGEPQYLVAALVAGLMVDIAIRLSSPRRKLTVAGAASAAAFVFAPGAVAIATTGLSWSVTLLLGVGIMAAGLGWALAALVGGRASGGQRAGT